MYIKVISFRYFQLGRPYLLGEIGRGRFFGTGRENPPLFDLKIVYSYVVEVSDSEYDLGLHGRALVSEIFAFYHLLKYVRGRPGRRGHVHLGHNFSIQICFQNFFNIFTFIKFMRVLRVYVGYLLLRVYVGYLLVFTFEGVCRVFTLRVYVGIYFEGVCRVFTLRVH